MLNIRLTLPKDSWSKDEKGELIGRLTDTVAGFASENGRGEIRDFVSVYIEETAEGGSSIGGKVLG